MIRALMEGPSTVPEIVYECGLSYTTVRRYVHALHKAGCVHIAGWDVDGNGRRTLRAWQLGQAKDKPRPAPIQNKDRAARYRERARVLQTAMEALHAD